MSRFFAFGWLKAAKRHLDGSSKSRSAGKGPQWFALFAAVALPLFLSAPAEASFLPTDFSAETDVFVAPVAPAGTGNRAMSSFTGPVTDALTSSGGPGSGSATAYAGLALRATASADSPAFGSADGAVNERVQNHFMVIAGPGFNGTTARVDFAFLLDGSLAAGDGAFADVSAQILTTIATPGGGTARFDFTQDLDVPSGQNDSASIFQPGTLAGTVAVGSDILIDARLNIEARANQVPVGNPHAAADFGSTFSFGVSSPDAVTIVWASDPFFSEQPHVESGVSAAPEPSSLALLAAAGGALLLHQSLVRRRQGRQSGEAAHPATQR
jgi:hypothetical protein